MKRYALEGTDWEGGTTCIARSNSIAEIKSDYRDNVGLSGWRDVWIWDREEREEIRPQKGKQ